MLAEKSFPTLDLFPSQYDIVEKRTSIFLTNLTFFYRRKIPYANGGAVSPAAKPMNPREEEPIYDTDSAGEIRGNPQRKPQIRFVKPRAQYAYQQAPKKGDSRSQEYGGLYQGTG